VEVIA
jgi:hypothetical protein